MKNFFPDRVFELDKLLKVSLYFAQCFFCRKHFESLDNSNNDRSTCCSFGGNLTTKRRTV